MLAEIPDPPPQSPFSTIILVLLVPAVFFFSLHLYRQNQIITALQNQSEIRHTRKDYKPPSSPSYPNPLIPFQNAPHFASNFRSPSMSSLDSAAPKTLDDVCKHLGSLNNAVSDLVSTIKHSGINTVEYAGPGLRTRATAPPFVPSRAQIATSCYGMPKRDVRRTMRTRTPVTYAYFGDNDELEEGEEDEESDWSDSELSDTPPQRAPNDDELEGVSEAGPSEQGVFSRRSSQHDTMFPSTIRSAGADGKIRDPQGPKWKSEKPLPDGQRPEREKKPKKSRKGKGKRDVEDKRG